VLGEIELLRKDKQIGSSLQAKVVITGGGEEMSLLEAHGDELPMLFIVSEVELRRTSGDALTISIERASSERCERCWRHVPTVSKESGICDRCQNALAEAGSS